jgi:hypothetical protein
LEIENFIREYGEFSDDAFGVGKRTLGIIEHLKKEIEELGKDPLDPLEWIDIIFLGMDGLRRLGYTPREIVEFMDAKFTVNKSRKWSSNKDENIAITHKKTLYVNRKVESPGIMSVADGYRLCPKDLHVTICYSRAQVDWGSEPFIPKTNFIELNKIIMRPTLFEDVV